MNSLKGKTVLVTGAAGFIGSYVCLRLLQQQSHVIGVDNLNDSYDASLKHGRLAQIESPNFSFIHLDVTHQAAMASLFNQHQFDVVVHLAAEAGQQHDEGNGEHVFNHNVQGFSVVLENCREHAVKQILYASSAAVYGDNDDLPVTEASNTDKPLSLYAASKKANEVLAHSYASLYDMRITGLRFFTVYGPWGRPDMALYKFARRILAGQPLNIHNQGQHSRDLIYIDDLLDAIELVLTTKINSAAAEPHQIYNLGHETAVDLTTMVKALEQQLGQRTEHNMLPRQAGEIQYNQADASLFQETYGWQARVGFDEGLKKFVDWYKSYHSV